MRKRERVLKIIEELNELYPIVKCSLNYKNPLELLIATQLSAQCTDERVNIVTVDLFKKYKNVEDFAGADIIDLENVIKPTGFFRNKAKNIKLCCISILHNYNGEIPNDINELVNLNGVGRKTANVFLGEIHNIPGIVVDTHAKRLSNRLCLTKNESPEKIEQDLMKILPKKIWTNFSHQLVAHGRNVCNARKPKCNECSLVELCCYKEKLLKK